MSILFEDNHLIIVDKPADLPTQVSLDHQEALETQLKAFLKKRDKKQGNVFLHAVHRLDKGVSGIVIFAKTSKALSRMQKLIRENKVKKTYQAVVEGVLKENFQKLTHPLVKQERKALVLFDDKAKLAKLSYTRLASNQKYSLVLINLETGRYHQIRAQFSYIGHPILGDAKYGSKSRKKALSLKHVEVSFPHIISGEQLTVKAPCSLAL